MNIIELNHIDLNSIGLNSKTIDSVGKSHGGKVKPYIAGHVTDDSSTFTFTVNGNESVTVPVDANGNWKWVVDRTITSLASAFASNLTIDSIVVCGINTITSGNQTFDGCKNIKSCTFKSCDASLLTDARYMFQNMGVAYNNKLILKLPKNFAPTLMERCFSGYRPLNRESLDKSVFKNATSIDIVLGSAKVDIADISEFYKINYWYRDMFYFNGTEIPTVILGTIKTNRKVDSTFFGNCIENIIFKGTFNVSLELNLCSKLTEQSVVNIFNAVAADGITLTFHATVYAMIEEQLEIEGSPIYEAYWNSDYDFNYASA